MWGSNCHVFGISRWVWAVGAVKRIFNKCLVLGSTHMVQFTSYPQMLRLVTPYSIQFSLKTSGEVFLKRYIFFKFLCYFKLFVFSYSPAFAQDHLHSHCKASTFDIFIQVLAPGSCSCNITEVVLCVIGFSIMKNVIVIIVKHIAAHTTQFLELISFDPKCLFVFFY